jgi:fibrillarin-like pre-rRNA processing protein
MPQEKFENVFLVGGRLATKSIAPGTRVYGERLVAEQGIEYRMWDAYRSKLAAAISKGLSDMPIRGGSRVLYLGAASGTTASHVSDVVGEKGAVYCIEFAPRSMRDLIGVCEKRRNMLPILADARKPEAYAKDVKRVDVIYEDVADPEQAAILEKNAAALLKKGGSALIAIKSQSIDVAKQPGEVYAEALARLKKRFDVLQTIELYPFDKDHLFVSLRYRG